MGARHVKFDAKKLAEAITRVLGDHFDNMKIVDVVVSPDRDRDGGRIVRVEVVFSGDLKGSDARKIAGASRWIRPTLDELVDEDTYPLLSFVSQVENERGHKRATR